MWSLWIQVILSFFAVTLDEFVVLILFFLRSFQAAESLLPIQVFLGHFLGFTLVLVLSFAIGCVGLVIPSQYLCYLGIIPLYMGVHDLYKRLPRYYGSKTNASLKKKGGKDEEIGFEDDTDNEDSKYNVSSEKDSNSSSNNNNRDNHAYSRSFDDNNIIVVERVQAENTMEMTPLLLSTASHNSHDGNNSNTNNIKIATISNYNSVTSTNDFIENSSTSTSIVHSNNHSIGHSDRNNATNSKTSQVCPPHLCARLSVTDPDMFLVIGTALAEASEEVAVFAPMFALVFQVNNGNSNSDNSHSNNNIWNIIIDNNRNSTLYNGNNNDNSSANNNSAIGDTNSSTNSSGSLSWQTLSVWAAMLVLLYALLLGELLVAYLVAAYLHRDNPQKNDDIGTTYNDSTNTSNNSNSTSNTNNSSRYDQEGVTDTQLSQWLWERFIKLGMPIVLIVVGVSVLLGAF